jgi:DNA-binding beta-propeller fold protein YncE
MRPLLALLLSALPRRKLSRRFPPAKSRTKSRYRRTLRTIDLCKHVRPRGIAWLRRNPVLVTTESTQTLLTVDIEAGKVTAAIETDQFGSHMVALAPVHDRAFVANIDMGSVSVIDLKQPRCIANIATGDGTEGIAVSPDLREAWVGNRDARTCSSPTLSQAQSRRRSSIRLP